MCNPGASTQVEKEFIKIGLTKPNNILRPKINEIVDLNLVKQLYVAGGEPSLMQEFKTLLARAIETNRTDIFLRIITNATNVNKEFAELLSHFPNKEFVVSLDGYDQVNKYSIIGNIKRLYTITSKYNISFSVTVSMWNICSLSKLIKFLNEEFSQPIIFLNEAVDGGIDNASPFNFPNKELALRDLESMKLLPNYQIDIFKNKLDYFISKINTTTIDTDKLKKFFDYNDLLDQSRNVKLIDYIPELEACRSYITKPI
jgi:sulfatase maturation enzyme AslB (radical SAM superfamily)